MISFLTPEGWKILMASSSIEMYSYKQQLLLMDTICS